VDEISVLGQGARVSWAVLAVGDGVDGVIEEDANVACVRRDGALE
jgi:hypothetical protein